jgi:hypothetical protein
MEVISWQSVTSGRLINRSHRYDRATNFRPIAHVAVSLWGGAKLELTAKWNDLGFVDRYRGEVSLTTEESVCPPRRRLRRKNGLPQNTHWRKLVPVSVRQNPQRQPIVAFRSAKGLLSLHH